MRRYNAGMLIRALIVLLLVLNLGVAAWWVLRDAPAPAASVEPPSGVAKLVLVKERAATGSALAPVATPPSPPLPSAAAAVSSAPTATPATDTTATGPATAQCFSLGPFASEEELVRARSELKPRAQALAVRTLPTGPVRAWRVLLPPLASLQEAQAVAERVSAAGFKDYFVVRAGAEANSLALGRFGSESAARRHADALVAAGFAARAEPIGGAGAVRWLDVRVAAGVDVAAAQADAAARERRSIDCGALR